MYLYLSKWCIDVFEYPEMRFLAEGDFFISGIDELWITYFKTDDENYMTQFEGNDVFDIAMFRNNGNRLEGW